MNIIDQTISTIKSFPTHSDAGSSLSVSDNPKRFTLTPEIVELVEQLQSFTDLDRDYELRAIGVETTGWDGPRSEVWSGLFHGYERDELAREIISLSGRCSGVYLMLNPVRCGRFAYMPGAQRMQPARYTAHDKDILERRVILFDFDPVRAEGHENDPATEDERAAAWECLVHVRDYLFARGWPAPTVIDTGNGFHLRYLLEAFPVEPDDDLIPRVLKAIAAKFSNDRMKVDTTVGNPARIARVPGAINKKGTASGDRPHRMVRLLEKGSIERVTREQLEREAADAPISTPRVRPVSHPTVSSPTKNGGIANTSEKIRRAQAYISKVEGAVSGQRGHDRTFRVACILVIGFGLSFDESLLLLVEWNHRCTPQWDLWELERKLKEAEKEPGERGHLLNGTSPSGTSPSGTLATDWDELLGDLGGEPYLVEPPESPFVSSKSDYVRVGRIVILDTPKSDADIIRELIGPSPSAIHCSQPIRRIATGVSIATCGCDRMFTLGCGRWSCDVCKSRKRFKIKLDNAPRAFRNVTHVWRGTEKEWDATRKRLKRDGFNSTVYSMVQPEELVLFVGVEGNPDEVSETIGLQRVTGFEAAQLFCQSVDAVPEDGPSKRFRPGRGWKDLPTVDIT